ncbi:hypothetical protein FA13DRAFT_1761377 [Coprinellus micaceus]|uniref:Uncharacterized protein n=1 Tax=Coprinellus micaceus TaxID=71717 RepID=A0A4Y7TUR7_COPMI|nr:hypothetical protein FA13DRAFT_1761377 [Coprinellus micaceus]
MASLPASSRSAQNVVLPDIAELFDEKFFDTLLPAPVDDDFDMVEDPSGDTTAVETPKNPMIDALNTTTNQTLTANSAPALASIPDGKGNREGFYKAFAWLYEKHPRTAILNIRTLAVPKEGEAAHGYWKDLLNILALATLDELSPSIEKPSFLHPPRETRPKKGRVGSKRVKKGEESEKPAEGAEAAPSGAKTEEHLKRNAERSKEAKKNREEGFATAHARLTTKLADPKYRALYITITRLFGERIIKDLAIADKVKTLSPDEDKLAVLKTISLAGKWAPTPACSHDKVTNLSSALALYLHHSKPPSLQFPPSIAGPIDTREKFVVLRQFLGKSVLKPLRELIECPEPYMASNQWKKIKYARVSSTAMKNNTERFFKHDPDGFQKYLIDVESGKKAISGATLFPHEIIGQIAELGQNNRDSTNAKYPALEEFKKSLRETQIRVAEGQWKSLVAKLRESGTLENSVAICDVSGSMGSIYGTSPVVAPPFNSGFISFSEKPQWIALDLEGKSLLETVDAMIRSDWGYNTDFNAVFMKLLLPLAKKHNIKQEDMIKRLFVFSDMQFDQASGQGRQAATWETNYDVIEQAYKEAGYEVPQIVFWDLNAKPGQTVEVTKERKGVAMMNGFSPALLKVFMGESEEAEAEAGWEAVNEKGETVKPAQNEFNPVNVMKKALLKESFAELKVLD